MNKLINKTVFWILLVMVVLEGVLLIMFIDVNVISRKTADRYASTTAEFAEENKRLSDEVDRMYALNDKYIIANEKLGKANINMGDAMRKYCPEGLVELTK